MKYFFKILALLTVLSSCNSSDDSNSETLKETPLINETPYFPPINTNTWETISPENLDWDTSAINELLAFVEEKNSESFIILYNGKIVIEWYGNGANNSSNHTWNSASKTLTSFTIGIAQEENLLNINDSSQGYLGEGWSSMTTEQESNISIRHHLTMTTGIDYNENNATCTAPECLIYLNEPGTFWYYDTGAYTLTHKIIEGATGINFKAYFNEKLRDKIGMQGVWLNLLDFEIFTSNARSMARYGILCLNKGKWENEQILNEAFFDEMTTTSQDLNKAYGYFWWLNGKNSFKLPTTTTEYNGELIPSAPSDLIASLGKDDQKIYIVPSKKLVIIRMGDSAGNSQFGPSGFDDELWKKMNAIFN